MEREKSRKTTNARSLLNLEKKGLLRCGLGITVKPEMGTASLALKKFTSIGGSTNISYIEFSTVEEVDCRSAKTFNCPVYISAEDQEWLMRKDSVIQNWLERSKAIYTSSSHRGQSRRTLPWYFLSSVN